MSGTIEELGRWKWTKHRQSLPSQPYTLWQTNDKHANYENIVPYMVISTLEKKDGELGRDSLYRGIRITVESRFIWE